MLRRSLKCHCTFVCITKRKMTSLWHQFHLKGSKSLFEAQILSVSRTKCRFFVENQTRVKKIMISSRAITNSQNWFLFTHSDYFSATSMIFIKNVATQHPQKSCLIITLNYRRVFYLRSIFATYSKPSRLEICSTCCVTQRRSVSAGHSCSRCWSAGLKKKLSTLEARLHHWNSKWPFHPGLFTYLNG